jgi:hypothetical protein
MTWLTWRQHRGESLIMLGVLAALAVFLLITGLNIANSFQQSGLNNCMVHATDSSTCGPLENTFMSQYGVLVTYVGYLLLLPALLGALVGAPLVARELEQRTHVLAWTQSVTRLRWLSVKLALVLGANLLAAGVLLALLIWWYRPFAQLIGTFGRNAYDLSGPVWLATVMLALALGIFAGALTRRTVLAIFLTIALFLAIRLPVEVWWRPNFMTPITVTWPLDAAPVTLSPQDWFFDQGLIDAQGSQYNGPINCDVTNMTPTQCLQSQGFQANYLTYQPADRFWTFQWIETGIYLAFAVLALGATVWLVRRLA